MIRTGRAKAFPRVPALPTGVGERAMREPCREKTQEPPEKSFDGRMAKGEAAVVQVPVRQIRRIAVHRHWRASGSKKGDPRVPFLLIISTRLAG